MDGTGSLFADFAAALKPEVESLIVSYPGSEPLSYAQLEALVRGRLPANRPFLLLGESFSGPVAVSIAASPPPGLVGLVLCCSFFRNPRPDLSLLGQLVAALPMHMPGAVANRLLFGRHSSARLRHALASALAQVSPATLRARFRAVLSVDVSSALAKVGVPVLYLRATEDLLVPPRVAAAVRRILPGTTIADIEGPHCLLQASPGASASELKAFLNHVVP
jgi:pimeloyl-ACP methyl ester carboxylesterase